MQRMQARPRRVSLVILSAGVLVIVAGLGLLLYALLAGEPSVQAPGNKVLRLTVPDMKRVRDLPV